MSPVVTGAVNVVVVEVVVGTAAGAWRTDQITHCSACSPAPSPARGSEPGGWGEHGLPWPEDSGAGPWQGAYSLDLHISLASRSLRASEAGGAGTGPGRTPSRTWKVRGAQGCPRTRAAGVQLKFRYSSCL